MNGRSAPAFGRFPRNGLGKRVIHLERAGTISKTFKFAPEARGELIIRNAKKLPRSNVAENQIVTGQLGQRLHARGCLHTPTQAGEMSAQGVRQRLRSTKRDRPTDRVRRHRQQHAKSSGQRLIESEKRVRPSPAKRARVRSLRKRLVRAVADEIACNPKRAIRNGCLGIIGKGRRASGMNSDHFSTKGRTRSAHAFPSTPNERCASSRLRSRITAVPSSSG